jgi:DNA-directed RNA polymerase subunit M/transcription elongation factor TFIIS
MPNVFTDMLVERPVLLDTKEDGKTRVRFKATQANVVNSNSRLYPYNVLNDSVEKSNELVKSNRMIGESPHPKHFIGKQGQVVFDTQIDNSVIKIYNQFIDEKGTVYVDAEVLDTAKGKDLKALIDAGVPVGISMRALGDSVRKQINGVMVDVATKLDIQSYDVVMNPATPGCEVVQVLTDSQVAEVLADDVQITVPNCPSCSSPLTPQDPDGDGDLDFYSCESCKEVYIPEENYRVSTVASQSLRKLPNDSDWDGYDLARQYKMNMAKTNDPNAMTDGKNKGDEEDVKLEDILKAMQDSPEFQALIEAKAKAIAQPALDAAQAQADAEAKAQALQKAKEETKAFTDSKLEELKSKLPEEVLTLMADSVKDATDKEVAGAIIDSMVNVYSKTSAKANLDSLGFDGTQTGEGGAVRVQVTNEQKPWGRQVHELLDSLDRMGEEFGHSHDESIRKYNKKFIDQIMDKFEKQVGYEAMKDSAAIVDSMVATDSVSVSTAQLLNQPTIQQALLVQSFQDVESLQFLAAETFEGAEVRWPVETFTSAATVNPTTGLTDLLVGEGTGIPESQINLAWLTFNPSWRRNAISLTTDVVNTLKSGPAKYDAITRGIYHISFDKRRKLDNLAYLEMVMASDEYQPLVVASETASGIGASAGQVTAVSNGTNVVYKYNLTNGGAANATAGTNPVVRPRTKTQILPSGQTQQVTSNPFTVKVSGSPLTMGYLDANGNVQAGTYAVDFENGIVYFTAGAGIDASHLPNFAYSAVTNYTRWSTTVTGGLTADQYYNTLLQTITQQVQLMGSAPRFNKPNLAIMSLNASQYIENAAMWYKLNSPDLGSLTGGGTSNMFGSRSGVNFARINAPWVAGDNRILLTQKGATRYAIETPYQIEGPYPKYDSNGNIVDAKLFYGRENSVMATPQTIDSNGNIINPKSRSIKLV